jgi:hypothetical protein
MPRTRSLATPPPRRSGASDRPRSVRNLTHPPKRLVKQTVAEEAVQEEREAPIASKQELILKHAEARAEAPQGLGPLGILGVVATCALIFAAWWFLPAIFGKPEPLSVPTISVPLENASSTTVRFVPQSSASSTERRLIVPLPSSTTSHSLR